MKAFLMENFSGVDPWYRIIFYNIILTGNVFLNHFKIRWGGVKQSWKRLKWKQHIYGTVHDNIGP